jgi:hypothetical protein
MTADANGLLIPISSFWASPNAGKQRETELSSSNSIENAWDELVDWFAQEHEWVTLVSSLESALA